MAEVVGVLGLISSILGILEGIDKTKTIIRNYVHTSSSLRAELVPVLGKLTAFAGVLRGLQLECELDETDNGRLQTLTHIRDPLLASEKAIKTIMSRLNQVISIGGVSLSFGKVLNKETTAALHMLDQTKSVLDLALTADQRTLLKSIEVYVRDVAADLHEIRGESKIHYQDLKDDLSSIRSNDAETERIHMKADVLVWISQVNYSSNFHAALLPTVEADESGNWFLESQQFEAWSGNSSSRGLVITGISGAGKTVLCAKAINHITLNKSITRLNSNIIYFFFDFNDISKQSVEGMIRSLVFQLLAKVQDLPQVVLEFYSNHRNASSPTKLPLLKHWCDILTSLLSSTQINFIFIDALDECAEAETNILQETLANLFKKTGSQVKWFLTCRPSQRSISLLQDVGFMHRAMNAGVIDRDIERYLLTRLLKDANLTSFGSLARDLIVSQITSKSSGMFRFAHCQLSGLAKMRDRRVKKVRDVLKAMPEDLYSTYSQILNGLYLCDDWQVVDRILAFVSYSARPVTVTEVAEFAILEDDMTTVKPEERFDDFSEILSLISGLVNIQDGILTLAHKSVQDFLVTQQQRGKFPPHQCKSRLLYEGADMYIARRCFQYLAFPQQPICEIVEARNVKDPNSRHLAKLLNDYPLLDYAASRWPHHVRTTELQKEAATQMRDTLRFNVKTNLWKAWLMLQRADIWETKVELARLLCETSIRSALVPGWICDFWRVRQNYRVRNDAKPTPASQDDLSGRDIATTSSTAKWKVATNDMKSSMTTQATATRSEDDNLPATTSRAQKKRDFYVKALMNFTSTDEGVLSFREGDLILILKDMYKDWWEGFLDGRRGLVPSNYVRRCGGETDEKVTGKLFYDLCVILLEVGLQRPLYAEMEERLANVCSHNDLRMHLDQLVALGRMVASTTGQQYGEVIRECLNNVRYSKEPGARNLFEIQDYAMMKLHSPLQSMLKSGFRASRSPLGGQITRTTATASTSVQSFGSAPSKPLFASMNDQYPTTYPMHMTRAGSHGFNTRQVRQQMQSSAPWEYKSVLQPDVRTILKKEFHPSKLSMEQYKKCREPWALSSIVTWIKDLTAGESELREHAVAEALVALFVHKVPTMNTTEVETLGARVVKEMFAVGALVKHEKWVKLGPGSSTGVLIQLANGGCYSSMVHDKQLRGRCYSYHCMRQRYSLYRLL